MIVICLSLNTTIDRVDISSPSSRDDELLMLPGLISHEVDRLLLVAIIRARYAQSVIPSEPFCIHSALVSPAELLVQGILNWCYRLKRSCVRAVLICKWNSLGKHRSVEGAR